MKEQISGLEKEILLGVIREERVPINLEFASMRWTVYLTDTSFNLTFEHSIAPGVLEETEALFVIDYHGQTLSFKTKITDLRRTSFVSPMPSVLNKELTHYEAPAAIFGMDASFVLGNEYYPINTEGAINLASKASFNPNFNNYILSALVDLFREQHNLLDLEFTFTTVTHRLTLLEQLAVSTAKSILLSATTITEASFLESLAAKIFPDHPYNTQAFVSATDFIRFTQEKKLTAAQVLTELKEYFQSTQSRNIFWELAIPVLCHKNCVGFIALRGTKDQPRPSWAKLQEYLSLAKVIGVAAYYNDYLAYRKDSKLPLPPLLIDAHASGIVLTSSLPAVVSNFIAGSEFDLGMILAKRKLRARISLQNTFHDGKLAYYFFNYCNFSPEDFRYYYENIYNKKLSDQEFVTLKQEGIDLDFLHLEYSGAQGMILQSFTQKK